ncbi:MAG: preprotein translocase subunit YajC [Desulfovibrionaceae bacterium]|jgi:preprotein translocase subunit YajC|nr:preprotein translocase subunit YajC [Desulfovibrionaceae bacterium]
MFFEDVAHAMATGAQGGEAGNPLIGFLPLIIMFAIFYFLLIRPQQKKAKQHKESLSALGRGHYILTGGGFYGRIVDVDGDVLTVELADNVQVKINRAYVAGKLEAAPEKLKGDKKAD